jgi:opacity protein-like surface antigen
MQKPSSIRQSFIFGLLICFAAALVPDRSGAQAVPIREKKAGISTFATFTRLTPDFGPFNNFGVMFGTDYARYTRWITPALEFRMKISHGSAVDQKTYGGGLRLERDFQRYHLFGNFLVSSGRINYHLKTPPNVPALPTTPNVIHTYTDTSIVYTYGGGLDYDISQNFTARGEFQYENWNLGKYGPITLTPSMWGFGVVYRIPFRPYVSR